jgi:hypothetical protein
MAMLVQSGESLRLREGSRRRRPRAAAATEFARALDALGIAQRQAARLFNVNVRHIRRWRHGDRRLPHGISLVVRLLAMGIITVDQVERAAVLAETEDAQTGAKPRHSHRDLVRTNGGANPRPPAPFVVSPAPEQRTKAAVPADLDQTTAEKVFALASDACRWPCGDPRRLDFHFCGSPVTRKPYCEEHRRAAYMQSIERRPSVPFRLSMKPTLKLVAAV